MKRLLVICLFLFSILSCQASRNERKVSNPMKATIFGRLADGREVHLYTLENRTGAMAQIIDYGATVTSLKVPDRNGKVEDVVLGYDTLDGYVRGTAYFGAVVGRYGNRIGKGRFALDGKQYQLSINDGENHLHGGRVGFNKVLWQVIPMDGQEASLRLRYVSADGEEGYPGTVTLDVTYTLTDRNELRVDYQGTTDKPTLLNPTQHTYFNLSGSFEKTILDHVLMIDADAYTPVDRTLIPTGKIETVSGTPLDFRVPTPIGARIDQPNEQLAFGRGYDHNWVLNGKAGELRKVAEVHHPGSGRTLTVLTDQPGLQFYSGNFLDGSAKGKQGVSYGHRSGFCLEAQVFPDSPNKPHFPSAVLRPGQTYRQTTIYQFSTR